MVEIKDNVLLIELYKYLYNKAFIEDNSSYIDKYLEIEEYITVNIIDLLPVEDQIKVNYLIPGLSIEEVDKRIDNLNKIIKEIV